MKKARIGNETLYNGISRIWGGWLLTTEGDPTALNELEDAQNADADREIEEINAIISDPSTHWEECDAESAEYVLKWINIWGI